jgi:hypothetical protein
VATVEWRDSFTVTNPFLSAMVHMHNCLLSVMDVYFHAQPGYTPTSDDQTKTPYAYHYSPIECSIAILIWAKGRP